MKLRYRTIQEENILFWFRGTKISNYRFYYNELPMGWNIDWNSSSWEGLNFFFWGKYGYISNYDKGIRIIKND